MSNYGIVEYFGSNETSYSCGYCKGMKGQNTDYGMWAHSLSPINYQNLIDRNWRRSGKYCYKPILEKTCCPMYTIRCDALNFKLRKSHKKVLKKFNRFLLTGEKPSKRRETELHNIVDDHLTVEPVLDEINLSKECISNFDQTSHKPDLISNKCDHKMETNSQLKPIPKSIGKRTKAKTLRIERKLKKIIEREKCDENKAKEIMNIEFMSKMKAKVKTIEDYLMENQNSRNTQHKLEIRFVSTLTDEYKDTFEASHEVYKKYQIAIHRDSDDKCTAKQYKRFLIDSPLEEEFCETNNELPNNFGSYHQQYWLDNKLIAVGVLDILPNCVSSVYLYYDPDYDFLSLGTYSAIREIQLVRQLQQFIPNLRYYYMGFYIHSCPKMKYKGKFSPSDLLCPETFSWHPISRCTPKLDVNKYSRFEEDLKAIDREGDGINNNEIKILINSQVMSYQQFKSVRKNISQKEKQQIKEYAKLIGRKCSKQILLFRS